MSNSTRDPRRDPIPGDEIQHCVTGIRREVVPALNAMSGMVLYRRVMYSLIRRCTLATWRQWARGAKVLKRGDEP